MRHIRALLACTALSFASAAPAHAQSSPAAIGMHINHPDKLVGRLPLNYGAARLWDTWWGSQLSDFQNTNTAPGTYNWAALDNIITFFKSRGVQVISWTFGNTPPWCHPGSSDKGTPCNRVAALADEKTYVSAVLARHGADFTYASPLNEPGGGEFWHPDDGSNTVSATTMAWATWFYSAVRAANPATLVLTPTFAGQFLFDSFYAQGGGALSDVHALHAYATFNYSTTVGAAVDFIVRVNNPSTDNGSFYVGSFTRPGGYQGQVVWDASGNGGMYVVPAGYSYMRDLRGKQVSVTPGQSVPLTRYPILLENQVWKQWRH